MRRKQIGDTGSKTTSDSSGQQQNCLADKRGFCQLGIWGIGGVPNGGSQENVVQIIKKKRQAQLEVPHSEIKVELDD